MSPEPVKPKKRGRPCLARSTSLDSNRTRRPAQPTIPHTEVERRYRERLNAELERLRGVLPTLQSREDADMIGAARPSKTMVLAVAIDYIRDLQRERDTAIAEVERLGGRVMVRTFG